VVSARPQSAAGYHELSGSRLWFSPATCTCRTGREIPSFFILAIKVVRFSPNRAAAPLDPPTVEIQYDPRKLRLRIRDNGKGIEPMVGDTGRQGHYGLPGMRERAKLIGGNLELWTKVQAGTKIELTIPAAAAYAKPDGQHGSRFFRKRAGAD